MENISQEEASSVELLGGDEQFEHWKKQHLAIQTQIDEIERRPHLTEADEIEAQRLKKQKLLLKDQMSSVLSCQGKAAEA